MTEILKSLKKRKKEETELKFKENIQAENTKQIRCIPSTIPRTRFLLVVVVTLFFFVCVSLYSLRDVFFLGFGSSSNLLI